MVSIALESEVSLALPAGIQAEALVAQLGEQPMNQFEPAPTKRATKKQAERQSQQLPKKVKAEDLIALRGEQP